MQPGLRHHYQKSCHVNVSNQIHLKGCHRKSESKNAPWRTPRYLCPMYLCPLRNSSSHLPLNKSSGQHVYFRTPVQFMCLDTNSIYTYTGRNLCFLTPLTETLSLLQIHATCEKRWCSRVRFLVCEAFKSISIETKIQKSDHPTPATENPHRNVISKCLKFRASKCHLDESLRVGVCYFNVAES